VLQECVAYIVHKDACGVTHHQESSEKRGESREQRAESREQRAESREQRAESGERRAESGEQAYLHEDAGRAA
jgi:hypothetical protein